MFEEIKSSLIKEETFNDLDNIIKEELTINNEVEQLSYQLYKIVIDNYKNAKFSKVEDNVSLKTIRLKNTNVFKKSFTIEMNFYNTNNKTIFNEMYRKYGCNNGKTDFNDNLIVINVGLYCGTIIDDFESVLQHEVEHVFQYVKKDGKLNTYGKGDFGQKLYNKAYVVLTNKDKYTKFQYNTAFLLYTLSDNEVDAFINQLYKDLVKSSPLKEKEVLNDSSIMSYWQQCKEIINDMNESGFIYSMALYSFGIKTKSDKEWFFKYMNNALERTIRKIGKTVIKARNDNEHNIAVQLNDLKEK